MKEKKYYLVSLSDGTKNTVEDGYSSEKIGFNIQLEAYAVEENGILVDILVGEKILDASKNYNPNIFDIRTFVEGGYGLFAVNKKEVEVNEVSTTLHFITRAATTEKVKAIIEMIKKTKKEANKQYESLQKAEVKFSEEINKNRK